MVLSYIILESPKTVKRFKIERKIHSNTTKITTTRTQLIDKNNDKEIYSCWPKLVVRSYR